MIRAVLALILLGLLVSAAPAAIVYAPVQYQYRDPVYGHPTFYYGGSNPLVFEYGGLYQQRYHISANPKHDIAISLATEGRFGYNLMHHGLINSTVLTYTDLLAPGINAYPYGFSVDDARNEAYANVPLYYRKSDLMASAYRAPDGNIIVPAQAPLPGTIQIMPYHAPTTQPSAQASPPSQPQPILIIPKGLLNKPLNSSKPLPVASAK